MSTVARTLTQDEVDVLELSAHGNSAGELWTLADLSREQLAALVEAYRVGTLITGGIAS